MRGTFGRGVLWVFPYEAILILVIPPRLPCEAAPVWSQLTKTFLLGNTYTFLDSAASGPSGAANSLISCAVFVSTSSWMIRARELPCNDTLSEWTPLSRRRMVSAATMEFDKREGDFNVQRIRARAPAY